MTTRRDFLRSLGVGGAMLAGGRPASSAPAAEVGDADAAVLRLIEANRPSRLKSLPPDFNGRVGATHVAGKYHFTNKPFLIEGAEKLIELGTRLGKFWFIPRNISGSYPFNSQWGRYETLAELARSEYFQQVFAMPFETFLLEAHSPFEEAWKKNQDGRFYERVTQDFYELTAHLYQNFKQRRVTVVLQHWEGDWMMRGSGVDWKTPPANWKEICDQMAKWLTARQAGVTRARREYGSGAKCRVAHATEVNRVNDGFKGIPNLTRNVLPQVELDLVSYSCYDAMEKPLTMWNCIEEIRQHARTGPLFGKGAVYLGEIGIPENDAPKRIAERWDEFMGVALAARIPYVAHWELYCNEFNTKLKPPPKVPVKRNEDMRGFWLVRPDGTLSESGRYFAELWKKQRA